MEARMRMGGSGNLSALKRRGATKDRALFSRLNYYCSPPPGFSPGKDWESLSDIRLPEKQRTYYFDLMRYAQYFPKNLRLKRYFGDSRDLFIINDLHLDDLGDKAQIDHLIIHKFGFLIIESKSVSTTVSINDYGEWTRHYNGQQGMQSPISQAKLQASALRGLRL